MNELAKFLFKETVKKYRMGGLIDFLDHYDIKYVVAGWLNGKVVIFSENEETLYNVIFDENGKYIKTFAVRNMSEKGLMNTLCGRLIVDDEK